jgi:hypothetical protein
LKVRSVQPKQSSSHLRLHREERVARQRASRRVRLQLQNLCCTSRNSLTQAAQTAVTGHYVIQSGHKNGPPVNKAPGLFHSSQNQPHRTPCSPWNYLRISSSLETEVSLPCSQHLTTKPWRELDDPVDKLWRI